MEYLTYDCLCKVELYFHAKVHEALNDGPLHEQVDLLHFLLLCRQRDQDVSEQHQPAENFCELGLAFVFLVLLLHVHADQLYEHACELSDVRADQFVEQLVLLLQHLLRNRAPQQVHDRQLSKFLLHAVVLIAVHEIKPP